MLILASSSPRRRELLAAINLDFQVDASEVPEVHMSGESPEDFAQRLAKEKAQAVAARHKDAFILGADTVVVVDHHVLGKPVNFKDAERMLKLLSGRAHEVITGVCLMLPRAADGSRRHLEVLTTTHVTMRAINEKELDEYIASGEPMDKAGAYAIQGGAAAFVEKIDGDYNNVVGLPVKQVLELLKENGAAFYRSPDADDDVAAEEEEIG